MKCILAFDKFKGSLTSEQASACAARAIREVFERIQDPEIVILPTADGGEGTVEAFLSACGGTRVECNVTPPQETPDSGCTVPAQFAFLEDGRCVMEMAGASGLALVPEDRRNPMHTSTYGTGEMIRAALELGVSKILLGLGGSATNDGGCGMAAALGAKFYAHDGTPILCPTGADLIRIGTVDLSGMDKRLEACEITACCDVDNPLCGEHGAAVVYGPQKGAIETDIPTLDAGLYNLAEILYRDYDIDIRTIPGAGAAGGMGGGVIAFLGGKLQSGIDAVLDAADMDRHLANADLILTGEGRVDGQTVHGKVVSGILRRAGHVQVPIYVFGGAVEREAMALYEQGASAIFSICPGPVALEDALCHAESYLFDAVYAAMKVYYDGYFAIAQKFCKPGLCEKFVAGLLQIKDRLAKELDDSEKM